MKRIYLISLIIFLCITVSIFLYWSHDVEKIFYKKYYYLWDKLKDFFLILGFAFLTAGKIKKAFWILSGFFFIRVIWQVWELENYISANQPKVIDWIFGLCVASILLIALPLNKFYGNKGFKNGRN